MDTLGPRGGHPVLPCAGHTVEMMASHEESPIPVRVMIVEDDPVTREHFAAVVRADPRTDLVAVHAFGREAIERMQAAAPDVLLIDLGLPDVHGTEVIRAAVGRLPACDVMVITVFADERNVFASIAAGALGYVLKDSRDAVLIDQILELRAGGAPMSPGTAAVLAAQRRPSEVHWTSLGRTRTRDLIRTTGTFK